MDGKLERGSKGAYRFGMIPARLVHLIFVLIYGLAVIAVPQVIAMEEADLESAVLGKWRYQKSKIGAKIDSLSTYKKAKKYEADMTIRILSTTSKVHIEGTWMVEGTDIKITITKTNNTLLFPVGKVLLKQQVEISGDEMRYLYDGKKETERRPESTGLMGGPTGTHGISSAHAGNVGGFARIPFGQADEPKPGSLCDFLYARGQRSGIRQNSLWPS